MVNDNVTIDKEITNSLKLFRNIIFQVTIILFIFQVLIGLNFENIVCNILCVSIIVPSTSFMIDRKNKSPEKSLIAVIIFLIILSNSLMPMLGTLLEGNALITTLTMPIDVFLHRALFGGILLIVFKAIHFSKSTLVEKIFIQIGSTFQSKKIISTKAIWILGLWGVSSFFLKSIITNNDLSKFMDGFAFCMWAPFLLVVYPYSEKLKLPKNQFGLYGFSLLMIAISLLSNSRMAMIGPIATMGCAWLITLVMGLTTINSSKIKRSFIIGFLGLFMLGSLEDLSASILIERNFRGQRTSEEQILATFDTFMNKTKLDDFKKKSTLIQKHGNEDEAWQENYIRNPFIGRLVQIKYDDNCFERVYSFSTSDVQQIQNITEDKLFSILPTPILSLLNISIDKKIVTSFSIGDIIDVLSGNGFLGGFKVGSILAHGFALFSWWYLPISFIVFYFIFASLSGLLKLSLKEKKVKIFNGLSTLGLILCFKIFNDTTIDGFTAPLGYIIRGIWQTIFLYYLSLKIVEIFTNIKGKVIHNL